MTGKSDSGAHGSYGALTLAALGIVFGDIGTSPLYAIRDAFHGPHAMAVNEGNILGVLSLIVWSLVVVISIKYLLFVLRADNNGEGGVLTLTSLASPKTQRTSGFSLAILYMGLFGSALLFGDGVITPAVTVLSAVEGLKVATPLFEPYMIPFAIGILFSLFYGQRFGTAKIGAIFGPVILIWFIVIGSIGICASTENVHVYSALNPQHAVEFFIHNGWKGVLALGAVFLVCTGGEALYADMGHVGKRPIQRAWFFVALPALLLNYFGQGAYLLSHPEGADNPFYQMAPSWSLYPLVGIATAAAVIASQALISGVFSLARQAVQLGYFPRMRIIHTSSHEIGQIYIPQVNWVLFLLTSGLVLQFKSSSALTAAYGIAVAVTMVVTTLLTNVVAKNLWKWNPVLLGIELLIFLIVDGAFLTANLTKIHDGGWFPLVLASAVFVLFTTWRTGRRLLKERLRLQSMPITDFIRQIKQHPPACVPGAAIFMTGDQKTTPLAMMQNVRHNKALHATNVMLTVISKEIPTVDRRERIEIDTFECGFYRVIAKYGFMETPDIHDILASCAEKGLKLQLSDITFFLGRETLLATNRPGMAIWREHLFAFMSRNAERATAYFNIPADQVFEVGMQVEI